mgnify:CR=1 FL=1
MHQYIHTSANPAGSKLTLVWVGANGIGAGPAPPTISAMALVAVLVRATWAGAKAAAEPARAARMENPTLMPRTENPRMDSRMGSQRAAQRVAPRDRSRHPTNLPSLVRRMDPKADPRVDPRADPRVGPRVDPRMDPRMLPREAQPKP